jgi:hypothetical protein
LQLVPGFHSIEKIFSHHTLDSLPILTADDFSGLKIGVSGGAVLWSRGEATKDQGKKEFCCSTLPGN